jgi:hypothetical protein
MFFAILVATHLSCGSALLVLRTSGRAFEDEADIGTPARRTLKGTRIHLREDVGQNNGTTTGAIPKSIERARDGCQCRLREQHLTASAVNLEN